MEQCCGALFPEGSVGVAVEAIALGKGLLAGTALAADNGVLRNWCGCLLLLLLEFGGVALGHSPGGALPLFGGGY